MDDSLLEREIEGLLSIEASPDFRARLRQRLAQEPPLRASRPLWPLIPAAIIAAVTVVIVLSVDAPSPQAPLLETRQPGGSIYETLAPSVAAPSVPPMVLRTAVAVRRAPAASTSHMEMIVYAPEVAAWRRLLTTIHSGTLGLSSMTHAADQSTTLPASDEFVLPPIVIEPLTPDSAEEGVRP